MDSLLFKASEIDREGIFVGNVAKNLQKNLRSSSTSPGAGKTNTVISHSALENVSNVKDAIFGKELILMNSKKQKENYIESHQEHR